MVIKIMNQNFELRILLPTDKDQLMTFGKSRLALLVADPMEREMQSWSARWRAEALDHYLPLGWSFGCFKNGEMRGYLLGQPLLFFRGQTQTLWIEHLECAEPELEPVLLDCAYRWARDKHLQCVVREGADGKWVEIKSSRSV
jgi:hypothetical protein